MKTKKDKNINNLIKRKQTTCRGSCWGSCLSRLGIYSTNNHTLRKHGAIVFVGIHPSYMPRWFLCTAKQAGLPWKSMNSNEPPRNKRLDFPLMLWVNPFSYWWLNRGLINITNYCLMSPLIDTDGLIFDMSVLFIISGLTTSSLNTIQPL